VGVRSYRDLIAWQRAMELVERVYAMTRRFPDDERYGLASQMRRAAVSIPSNIAEGHGRLHRPDYLRFLSVARGSFMEVETQVEIADRLGYLSTEEMADLAGPLREVGRLLNGLVRSLRLDLGSTVKEDSYMLYTPLAETEPMDSSPPNPVVPSPTDSPKIASSESPTANPGPLPPDP